MIQVQVQAVSHRTASDGPAGDELRPPSFFLVGRGSTTMPRAGCFLATLRFSITSRTPSERRGFIMLLMPVMVLMAEREMRGWRSHAASGA